MGISYGADSVTNGLIYSVDAGDENSYPGSGTTWFDLCGENNTTINGATHNSDGYFTFDGTNDYCQVTSDGSNYFNKQTFTIEFWCLSSGTSTSGHALWAYDIQNSAPFYQHHLRFIYNDGLTTNNHPFAGGNYGGSWGTIGGNEANRSFHSGRDDSGTGDRDGFHNFDYTHNQWIHFVWVLEDSGDNKISKMYQNSTLLHTYTSTGWTDITYSAKPINIGYSVALAGAYFQGNIATVKFYDRVLSSQEVTQNFNAHRNRFGV